VAGDVPSVCGKGHGKRENYEATISDTAASYAISDERGARKIIWTTGNEPQ